MPQNPLDLAPPHRRPPSSRRPGVGNGDAVMGVVTSAESHLNSRIDTPPSQENEPQCDDNATTGYPPV